MLFTVSLLILATSALADARALSSRFASSNRSRGLAIARTSATACASNSRAITRYRVSLTLTGAKARWQRFRHRFRPRVHNERRLAHSPRTLKDLQWRGLQK